MFVKKFWKKKEDNKKDNSIPSSKPVSSEDVQDLEQNAMTAKRNDGRSASDAEDHHYPGVELEDYYIYYLQDSLRDSMATRAKAIYITRREALIEIDRHTVLNSGKKNSVSDKGFELAPIALEELFEVGKDIQLKLQVPFRNEFIRATGRILEFYDNTSDVVHVKLKYTKILGGDNEVLFDTILDMLM